MATFLFKVSVTDGWRFALSHLVGKFQGSGNPSSDGVRYCRETSLVAPYGLKKLRKRTLLKESIDMIGKLPTDCLVAMKDSKRESFVEDNEVPIGVKNFGELFLNMFRELFTDCKVIAGCFYLTASGERRDDGVVRPNDSPSAGRISLSFASEFPLRERCKKVRNIGRVSVVERKIVGVAVKDATEDRIVFPGWKGNLSTGNCNGGVGDLIPAFSISRPGRRIIRIKLHGGKERVGHRPVMGTDLNGREPKTSTEKNGKSQEVAKRSDLNGREPLETSRRREGRKKWGLT